MVDFSGNWESLFLGIVLNREDEKYFDARETALAHSNLDQQRQHPTDIIFIVLVGKMLDKLVYGPGALSPYRAPRQCQGLKAIPSPKLFHTTLCTHMSFIIFNFGKRSLRSGTRLVRIWKSTCSRGTTFAHWIKSGSPPNSARAGSVSHRFLVTA